MADFGVPGNRAVEEGAAEIEYTTVKAEVINNLVFVTSEAAPYSKTGGLGDVCGSLPIALAGRGHRVMVISPRYLNGTSADKNYSRAKDLGVRVTVHCFGGSQEVSFYHEYRDGVDWVTLFLHRFFLWSFDKSFLIAFWLLFFYRFLLIISLTIDLVILTEIVKEPLVIISFGSLYYAMRRVRLLSCCLLEGSLMERSLSSLSMTGMPDLFPCKRFPHSLYL